MAETLMGSLTDRCEAGASIDMARSHEGALGPEHHFLVAATTSKTDALFNQTGAQSQAACPGLNQEQAQLRDSVASLNDKNRADDLPIHFRDPAPFPGWPI